MRMMIPLLSVAAIAACSPPIPDSGPQGVGFENYDNYIEQKRARDAQLARGGPPSVAAPVSPARPQTEAQATAAAAVAAIQPTGGQVGAPLDARVAADPNNAAISDEQDFGAVASRQSIASDAQRRANQSAQYEVVAPTALPDRPSGTAPTPIEFAVQVSHPVGQKQYSRSAIGRNKSAANCAGYATSDLAQEAFLNAGGPKKDKLKLDPDGDGYACGWNPAKYRQLVQG